MRSFDTPHARTLRKELVTATQALAETQRLYQAALANAEDCEWSADTATSLQQAGRAYALAVTKYSHAAMAWLSYADRQAKSLKRENTSET